MLNAGGGATPQAQEALARLCETYWYPLYAFVRRGGYSPADAQDLTQEFFARLLANNWIARADPHKGRFRSFLLMVMKRFLAKEWEKARALKRGGNLPPIARGLETAEGRYTNEPADTRTPEQLFERQWALTLLQTVLRHIRGEYVKAGRGELFEKLEPSLTADRATLPYAQLARDLGMTEGAVKVAVFRLRERYRACLRSEIAQTVASPAEVDGELRHLCRVLARG